MEFNDDTKAISIRLHNDVIEELRIIGSAENRNRTNMIQVLLNEALAARKASHAIDANEGDRS